MKKAYNYEIKHDKEKVRAGLMVQGFANALLEVSKVSTMGAKTYGDNTWQDVEIQRYIDSTARHYFDYMRGEEIDHESGLLALAHLAWNTLALLELTLKDKDRKSKELKK